jgi:hypothetical protein
MSVSTVETDYQGALKGAEGPIEVALAVEISRLQSIGLGPYHLVAAT